MPVGGERDFGCSEGSLYRVVLHISVAQLEIKNGTKCVSSISGESTGVEIDFTYQVGIEDSHRTTGGSLRTEVIDIGNFHSIQVETDFQKENHRAQSSRCGIQLVRKQLPDKTVQCVKCPDWLPDIFSISCNPIMRRLTGLSKSRRKGEAVTVTPASFGQVLFHLY